MCAIMRQFGGGLIDGRSAGTEPDAQVHDLSAVAVAELGADMSDQVPTRLEPGMLTAADRIIVLGNESPSRRRRGHSGVDRDVGDPRPRRGDRRTGASD